MAGELQAKSVNIYIDDAPAVEAYDRLSKKQDGYNKKIEEGEKKAAELSKALKKALDAGKSGESFQKRLDAVNKSLEKNREAAAKVTDQQKALALQIESKSGPSLKSQTALVQRLWNEYQRLGANTKEAEQKLQEYAAAGRVLDGMKDRVAAVRRAQDDAAKSGSSFFGSFFGNVAANVVQQAASAIAGFFQGTAEEALEAEETAARFTATLENAGRSDVFDRLMDKANEMAEKFKYLDNDEVVGVFDKLITYGKLTEKQIGDLTPVIIDFAAKQRISITEATDVMTKALEGNGKALKTYGVDLSGTKTEAERLGVIMTELKGKVEGAGQAFMETGNGGVAVSKQEIANLKEEIGTGLMPAIKSVLGAFNTMLKGVATGFRTVKGWIEDLRTGAALGSTKESEREAGRLMRARTEGREDNIKQYEKYTEAQLKAQEPVILDLIAQSDERLKKALQKKDQGGIFQARFDLERLKGEQEALKVLQDKRVIGTGGGTDENAENKKAEEAKKRREDARKKAEQNAEEWAKFLKEQSRDLAEFNETEEEKELNRLYELYQEKLKLVTGSEAEIRAEKAKAQEVYEDRVIQIKAKYGRLYLAEEEKLQKEREAAQKESEKRMQDLAAKAMADGQRQLLQVTRALQEGEERSFRNKMAKLELDVMRSTGVKKLQALLVQLKAQRDAELANTELTENEKLVIEEKYRQAKRDMITQSVAEWVQYGLSIVQEGLRIFELYSQGKQQKEDAELARMQRRNERERNGYKTLLNNKLISQQEYNKKIAALDAQEEAKKKANLQKQFERQKKIDIAQALINGAMGITRTIAQMGFPLAIPFIATSIYATAKEISNIRKQEPQFEDGGTLLEGPSHKDGGVQLYGRNGHYYGEAEGGEVILSRKTVRNNPDLVGALLHSSMKRGGQRIEPAYRSRSYQSIDYSGMTRSIQRTRFFANGGTVPAQGIAPGAAQQPVPANNERMELLLDAVLRQLQTPIMAYTVLSQHEAKAGELKQIMKDATFKKE